MQGKIIRGIAGFYYVHTTHREPAAVYECKAKGIFRKEKIKPLPGDEVELEVLDESEKKGNIIRILPRNNELIRPAVANIDQALVIFAAASPEPNLNLLDRFLISMEQRGIRPVICFNKADLAEEKKKEQLRESYRNTGYPVLFVSAREKTGLEEIRRILEGKTTTVAGPSGVGKSSLINLLQDGVSMATGEISSKIERGKHTTRHTELICIQDGTYILDTPGFSSIQLFDMEKEDLYRFLPEMAEREKGCRFVGCAHVKEPDCAIRQAVEAQEISQSRYDNYLLLYEELKQKRKY